VKTYKINETFYSLQGEGFFTGTPSFFIRFSGCNLRCPFCDTQHEAGCHIELTEIVRRAAQCPARHVILTGGEPSLFVDDALIDALHSVGKFVAVETNGTHALPTGVDWITLSPKTPCLESPSQSLDVGATILRDSKKPAAALPPVILKQCDELKVVFNGKPPATYPNVKAHHHFLQPCDTGNCNRNAALTAAAIRWILAHPTWRLSLQTHKLTGIR